MDSGCRGGEGLDKLLSVEPYALFPFISCFIAFFFAMIPATYGLCSDLYNVYTCALRSWFGSWCFLFVPSLGSHQNENRMSYTSAFRQYPPA